MRLIICLLALLPGLYCPGQGTSAPPVDSLEQRMQAAHTPGFVENKGQLTDASGRPVPFVLFSHEGPGVNLYITETGLTWEFFTLRKEPFSEAELKQWEEMGGENTKLRKNKKMFDWTRVDMVLEGASINRDHIRTEGSSNHHLNYFLGHCPNGIMEVHSYEQIVITGIYPGIDWVIYKGDGEGFKYDFIVHPGSDPAMIKMVYQSANPIVADEKGNWELHTALGSLKELKPFSYQHHSDEVQSAFKIESPGGKMWAGGSEMYHETSITLEIGWYDTAASLVIDPQLTWATFFGGNSTEGAFSINTDLYGNAFLTGYTYPSNFPSLDAGTYFQGSSSASSEAFITKFSGDGALLWSTVYGGLNNETGRAITTDLYGNVFFTGVTNSASFPLEDAGTFFQGIFSPPGTMNADLFIVKFDNNGDRLWATLYGGQFVEEGYAIETDVFGNLFVTGLTASSDFPVQDAGTFFDAADVGAHGFILKFDNDGNRIWATCYGSAVGEGLATDSEGNLFVTGNVSGNNFPFLDAGTFFQGANAGLMDMFVAKFDNDGNQLWSTLYGGTGVEYGYNIDTDPSGNVFILGKTNSTNFPVLDGGGYFQPATAGGYDACLLKFDNLGTLQWSTYFGGNMDEYHPWAISSTGNLSTDACGNAYISFQTTSTNIPVLSFGSGFYNPMYSGGGSDVVIARFAGNSMLEWCTYAGGDGKDFRSPLDVDPSGDLFITGEWGVDLGFSMDESTYPLTNPGVSAHFDNSYGGVDDCFMLKFDFPEVGNLDLAVTDAGCGAPGSCTVTVSGAPGPYNYFWSSGHQVLGSMDPANTVSNLAPGIYVVTVQLAGCVLHETFEVVNGGVPVESNVTYTLCTGDSILIGPGYYAAGSYDVTLEDAAANGCDSIVHAVIGNFPLPAAGQQQINLCTGDSSLVGAIYYSQQGTYYDTLFNATSNGCDSVVAHQLNYFSPIIFSATIHDDTCHAGAGWIEIIPTNTALPVSYQWDDGSTNAVLTGLSEGIYTVLITDGHGCSLSYSAGINDPGENCDAYIFIPNVFTPNGDDANDEFTLLAHLVDFSSITIVNRWGVTLFESNDIQHSWNGKTPSGEDAPDGTYFFFLEYRIYGELYQKQGTVTLAR